MPINPSQKPIYESISMLHPDGTVMCMTSLKRAHWYVSRDIAKWTNEQKTHFQLNFLPQGKGKSTIPFYTETIQNICVVCGIEQNLNKHHVVPYVFRKRLKSQFKDKNHHDILAICIGCHEIYEEEANKLKIFISKQYGTEINQKKLNPNIKHNKKVLDAKKLLSAGLKLPQERIKELVIIAKKSLLPVVIQDNTHWAEKIIKEITKTDEKTQDFIIMWRNHFLNTMKPKFMPKNWNVNLSEYKK